MAFFCYQSYGEGPIVFTLLWVLSELNMSAVELNRFIVRVGHGLAIGVFVLSMMLSVAVAVFWLMN